MKPPPLTHPDKPLFPSDGITKAVLADYYKAVSPYLLPALHNRPVIIQRYPQGIKKKGFIQQHPNDYFPDWYKTCQLKSKTKGTKEFLLCQNESSLLYLVNNEMIAIHRWLSTYKTVEKPNLLIIDLDPPPNSFHLVCKAAKIFRKILTREKLSPLVMTTGSHGLHVIAVIKPKHNFTTVREKVLRWAQEVVEAYPKEFTLEMNKRKRGKRVFIDTLRNAYGHSAIAPFSVRPLPHAPIAMPIPWDEVDNPTLNAQKYTVKNFHRYLSRSLKAWHL